MMTEFRALCAELADAYLRTLEHINNSTWLGYEPSDDPLLQRARASLADEPPEPAPPADGEVAELVEWLQEEADDYECIGCEDSAAKCKRAAELLQRQVLVQVAVSDALIKAECALSDIAEGEPMTDEGDPLKWAERRCADTLAIIRPTMMQHKIRTSEWPPVAATAKPLPEVDE